MRNWTKITKREDYAAQEGAREKLAKNRRHKRWMRAVSVLASVMVFVTTYSMILPTLTATRTDLPDDTDANEVRWTRETPAWKGELLALHIDEAEQAARLAVVVDPRPEEETPVVTAAISTQEIDVDALAAAGVLVLQDDADVNAHADTNININADANASAAEALPLAISPAAEKTATADAAGAEAPAAEAARGADALAEAAAEAAILNGPAALVELPMDSEAIEVLNPALAPVYPTLSEDVEVLLKDVKSAGILEAQDFAALVAETNRTLEIIETPQATEEADAAADADGAEGEADAVEEETAAADGQDAADAALDADTVEGDADAAAGEEDDSEMAIADEQDDDAAAVTDAETPAEADSAVADAESEDADAEAAGEDPASEEAVAGDAEDAESAEALTPSEGDADKTGEATELTDAERLQLEKDAKSAALPITLSRVVDGVTVTAAFGRDVFPAGVQMLVHPEDSEVYVEQVADATGRTRCELKPLDIQFVVGGQEVEPDGSVQITFEAEFLTEDAQPAVVHVTDDGSAETVDSNLEDGQLTLTTDSFSVYVIAYTVDFAYDGLEYSLAGGSAITLSALFEALGIDRSVEDVESVEFSDGELVWIGQADEDTTIGALKEAHELACEYSAELTEEQIAESNAQTVKAGEWVLISLKAFETEESLTVTMKNGDSFQILVTDAMDTSQNPSKGTVFTGRDTRSLDNITINLYNYGPASLDRESNNLLNNANSNTGINKNHALKFFAYGKTPYDPNMPYGLNSTYGINHFSGGTPAIQGIVNNKLVNGYPSLVSNNESLAYLFDSTTIENNGKVIYPDVTGLFQYDETTKMLSYDSNNNYAYYDISSNNVNREFKLSDTFPEEGSDWGIGFFPFNEWNSYYNCVHGADIDWCNSKNTNRVGHYDHHFGMQVNAEFIMTADKKLDIVGDNITEEDKEIVFNFTGDDDMWVFVDNVLVLDIGGVHNPVGGSINFTNGTVHIDKAVKVGDTPQYTGYGYNTKLSEDKVNAYEATIADLFADAGETWNDSPFSTHEIKVFYLERGGCYSNLKMEFNIPTYKTLTMEKKVKGLTNIERDKYENEEFTYIVKTAHQESPKDSDYTVYSTEYSTMNDTVEASYTVQQIIDWQRDVAKGSKTLNDTEKKALDQLKSKNHTVKYEWVDGVTDLVPIYGYPIGEDGKIKLKDGEKITITHLPRTDSFYIAEENALNMDQFEEPHAERLFDMNENGSFVTHEEEVDLDTDKTNGQQILDWKTPHYDLRDTEEIVFTNTLKEQNLDIIKEWNDGIPADNHSAVQYYISASVDEGIDYIEAYKQGTGENTKYPSLYAELYSSPDNAQNNVVSESQKHVVNLIGSNGQYQRFTLSKDTNWQAAIEHLPAVTVDDKVITYKVHEIAPEGYVSQLSEPVRKRNVDVFKLYPDSESMLQHENEKIRIKLYRVSEDNKIEYIKGNYPNYEWVDNKTNGSDYTIEYHDKAEKYQSPDNSTSWFDTNYYYRFKGLDPKYKYYFEEVYDGDSTTKGLVKYDRDLDEYTILNTKSTFIKIIKVEKGEKNSAHTLAGAVFRLTRVDSNGNEDRTNPYDSREMTVDATTGALTFTGLSTGRYKLEEITPPRGYVLVESPWYINIAADGTASLEGNPSLASKNNSSSATNEFYIENEPGVELPSTGGPGTAPFTAAGALLITTAGILVIRRKRRGARMH